MKKLVLVMAIVAMGIVISAFNQSNIAGSVAVEEEFGGDITFPDNIKSILDNSCWGCHNSESQNEKGKKKLQFDKLNELSTSKKVSKLGKIVKILGKGEMPPEKVLQKYPEMSLTDETKSELVNWANSQKDELLKN